MATPSSGTITMFDINSAFNRGNDLNAYRGTVWYVPNSLTTGTFPSGQIAFSDFYNKTGTNPVVPSPDGGVSYTIPGVYQFVVPLFRTSFSVVLWGGGGGGGGGGGTVGSFTDPDNPNLHGVAGGASSFAASVIANGGSGGGNAGRDRSGGVPSGYGGTGGTASGGDVNTSGYDGGAGFTGYNNAHGGGSPNGGGDTPNQNGGAGTNGVAGNPPGGGGQGMVGDRGAKFWAIAGGGGGGAYASKTYNPSQLVAGTTIQLVVAAGGASGPTTQGLYGGVGANGKIILNWS